MLSTKKYFPLTGIFFASFTTIYLLVKIVFFSPSYFNADYKNPAESLFSLKIPRNLHFCGEAVPQNDFSIKENMDKAFISRSHKASVFLLFRRAALWFPAIEQILTKNNIPDDIKYIAMAESHLTNALSPHGAAGFWQFVPSTAIHYGLEVNNEVDERYNVEKSTEAACRFFKESYKRFNSWTLAAAAYNLGTGGIEKQLKKQKSGNYYNLVLNKETARYMYRVLALKTLMESNTKTKKQKPLKNFYGVPLVSFKVDSAISNLASFAEKMGYTYSILKVFNPWLRVNTLTNSEHKTYLIKFPKKDYYKTNLSSFEGDLVREENPDSVKPAATVNDTVKIVVEKDSVKKTRKDTNKHE